MSISRFQSVSDWHDRAALSQAYKIIAVNIHGHNPDIGATEEDIWEVGGTETLLTTGTTLYLSSTNAGDTAEIIQVHGLDEDWAFQTKTVTLTGQSQVALPGLWTRVFTGWQVSAEPACSGDVYIAELDAGIVGGIPQTASLIHGFINFTNDAQKVEKAMYTVPAGYDAAIHVLHVDMVNTTGASRSAQSLLEVQELAQGATVAIPSWAPWRRVDTGGLLSDGQSEHTRPFDFPEVFGPLTNIHIRATATASSEVVGKLVLVLHER